MDDIKRLKKWYAGELKRRDKTIDQLKEKNDILMRTTLKNSTKIAELTEKLNKSLKQKHI